MLDTEPLISCEATARLRSSRLITGGEAPATGRSQIAEGDSIFFAEKPPIEIGRWSRRPDGR
ncbi:MAG TPA: hypothetical protein G4N94_12415 [Caldilineae bacterium]|nr:hypothetical protein [Caldilineae bacterium]